jgi:hypothetical protein
MDEQVAENEPRLLAKSVKCFGEGKLLVSMLRERFGSANNDE